MEGGKEGYILLCSANILYHKNNDLVSDDIMINILIKYIYKPAMMPRSGVKRAVRAPYTNAAPGE
jgi:hypothetical protein